MQIIDAVKSKEEIKRIATLLEKYYSSIYSHMWIFGVNAALRISDLRLITMEHALTGTLTLIEGKTKKWSSIPLNHTVLSVVQLRHALSPHHTFLFQVDCNRAKNKPISRQSVSAAFKEVGTILGLKLGTHSMRKTLGWTMYSAGERIERICKVLNHKDTGVTMRYLGLTQADIDSPITSMNSVFSWFTLYSLLSLYTGNAV